jgi:hypothetical protein
MTIDGLLQSVVAAGDIIEVLPGIFREVASVAVSGFNPAGQLALFIAFADGTSGIFRASLPVPALPDFDQWAEQIADPGTRDGESDPDGDGIPNILEFAFGFDPGRQEATEFPRITLLRTGGDSGGEMLTIEFPRIILQDTVEYIVEVSTDLVHWYSGDGSVGIVSTEMTGDGMESVVVRDLTDPAADKRCFIRIRVAY